MRNTIIVIVLALIAGLAGVWIGKTLFLAAPNDSADLHAEVHNSLNLSRQQDREISVIEKDFAKQKQVLEEKLKAANGSLTDAIQKDRELSAEVKLAGDEYLKVLGELQNETLRHIFSMRSVLNEQQAKQFDVIVIRSLHDAAN
ncbi:hypothetical protein MNBD_ALPHA06-1833 [hydrothermal vent metagenome]|uniref:Heavy metal resistance protein n=1 Tax=hydrothermal vent metagenome TaxID=652676 RepID=A0A3B0SD22_9ZZZZ